MGPRGREEAKALRRRRGVGKGSKTSERQRKKGGKREERS
jgi:hypothetical protein